MSVPSSPAAPVTVIGGFAIDHREGSPASPGGCPAFVGPVLAKHSGPTGIVAKLADADRPLFSPLLAEAAVPIQVLPATRTTSFSMRWEGERRLLRVEAIGDPFTAQELSDALLHAGVLASSQPGAPASPHAGAPVPVHAAAPAPSCAATPAGPHLDAPPGRPWVHLAPLLRSDFPSETIQMLSERGLLISYDGQGLVREPELGDLAVDDRYQPSILGCISVLKLDEREADVLAGGRFDLQAAERLRVPEVLVTLGSRGCDLYHEGSRTHLPLAASPGSSSPLEVPGPQSVGAGDVFVVSYVCERARGAPPIGAARRAGEIVAERLQARLARGRRRGT